MKNKRYTYEDVLGSFQAEVEDFKNQVARVPARVNDPKDVELHAGKIYQEKYKDALHPSVLDQYKVK
jgi:hypothetical protein